MKREVMWFALAIVLGAIFVIASLYVNFSQASKPPPLTFDRLELLSQTDFCPGDTVQFYVEGQITQAPVIIRVVRNVYDPATNNNVVTDYTPSWRTVWKVGPWVNPAGSYLLPASLAPGVYELHFAAQAVESDTLATASVPFRIREGCR